MDPLIIIFPLEIVALCTLLHELGHIIIAKYYARSPHLDIGIKKGQPGIFASSKIPYEINNGNDLNRLLKEEIRITQAGVLSIIPAIILLSLYPVFWQFCLILITVFMGYSIYEIGWVITNMGIEKIGKFEFNDN